MQKVNKNTPLNKGDIILLKPIENSVENSMKTFVGSLRDYGNKKSFSGCMEQLFVHYKISGNITKFNRPFVFAWYKGKFLALAGLGQREEYGIYCYIEIYKLDKKEYKNFVTTDKQYKKYQLKEKMCDKLV